MELPVPPPNMHVNRDDHPFEVFDIPTRTWTVQATKSLKDGDIPALDLGSTLTYHPPLGLDPCTSIPDGIG